MTVGRSVGPGVATFQAAITNCQCNSSGYSILFYFQFFNADGCLGDGGDVGGHGGGGGTGGERCIKQVIDAGGWSAATYQAAITNCQCNLSGYSILFYVQFFFADGCLVRRGGGGGGGGKGGMKGGGRGV